MNHLLGESHPGFFLFQAAMSGELETVPRRHWEASRREGTGRHSSSSNSSFSSFSNSSSSGGTFCPRRPQCNSSSSCWPATTAEGPCCRPQPLCRSTTSSNSSSSRHLHHQRWYSRKLADFIFNSYYHCFPLLALSPPRQGKQPLALAGPRPPPGTEFANAKKYLRE